MTAVDDGAAQGLSSRPDVARYPAVSLRAAEALARAGGLLMRRLRWLELTPSYECNNRCLGCFSVVDRSPAMSPRETMANLALGRNQGADCLWIGGGEPTLRRELFAVAREARRMGYARVKLQTNGMMLAYPEYVRKCVEAGVTEVNLAIKGATAETHDALTRTPGCHALVLQAMGQCRAQGLALEADVLVYKRNAAEIPAMVRAYTPLGVERYNLWMLSASDDASREVRDEVPRIADVMPFVTEAMDLGLSVRPDFITSLHTPACTVPASHRACLFSARDLDLLVTNPGGHRFRLETSPLEGGLYPDGCASCSVRDRCGGVRADYAKHHGTLEFKAV